jgi:hypothetical protein
MKQHNRLLPVLLLGICARLAGAAEVEVSIRFFDKKIYYDSLSEPIMVELTVANRSPEAFSFKLAQERSFSVDFDIRTLQNRPVESTDALMRKRTLSRNIYFREVTIEPGETFSFVENLRDYSMLNTSGAYIVQAKLYPELYKAEETAGLLPSNRLSLNLRPLPVTEPEGIPLALDVETNAVLSRESLPPDQVVAYMLSARQKGQWEKFFLYLDLEAMIARDGARKRSWLAESEEGRRRLLDRYRKDLQQAVVDGDISTIPLEFNIVRTVYGPEEGTVTVEEVFRTGMYRERKRYTYYLKKWDDIWTIIDYDVLNLRTE